MYKGRRSGLRLLAGLGIAAVFAVSGCASQSDSQMPLATSSSGSVTPEPTSAAPSPSASLLPDASRSPTASTSPSASQVHAVDGTVGRDIGATTTESDNRSGTVTVVHVTPASAGGSSVTMVAPCDGGTVSVTAHPDGAGVAMSTTLHGVPDSTPWWGGVGSTPEVDAGGEEPPGRTYHATHGTLTVSGTDLHNWAPGYGLAWPQSVNGGFSGARDGNLICTGTVYLTSKRAFAYGYPMSLEVERDTDVLRVEALRVAVPGLWRVTAVVQSANVAQHDAATVKTDTSRAWSDGPKIYGFNVDFTGWRSLGDFTKVTVTATSRDGKHTFWRSIARTP